MTRYRRHTAIISVYRPISTQKLQRQ